MTPDEREFLHRIEAKLDAQGIRCEGCREKIDGHHLTLYGQRGDNGVVGTVTKLTERDDTRRRFLAASLSIGGVVAGLCGAFGAAIIKVFFGG
jgi:hypothetical protein